MEEAAPDARGPRPSSDVLQPHQHPPRPGCSAQQNPICLQFRRQAFAADGQFRIDACCAHLGRAFRAGLSESLRATSLTCTLARGCMFSSTGLEDFSGFISQPHLQSIKTPQRALMFPLYFGASPNQIFSGEDDVTVTMVIMCKRDQKPPRKHCQRWDFTAFTSTG